MSDPRKESLVHVELGPRSYDIHLGTDLMEQAGTLLSPLLPNARTVIVTDTNVANTQLPRLAAGLDAANIAHETITLPAGETTKSFTNLEYLTGRLISLGVERNDMIIALGGGVIGDITGFSAAILRRGCRFAQIPTTLLAQVDSSVGGKTAINTPQGKNLIGAFYQPAIVIADITALSTLPARELRAGYAEVVKYGALGDAPFFDWLEQNGASLLAGNEKAMLHAVQKSCEAKAAIVAADEREAGKRALLNLGHTFGHALEAAFGFSEQLLHGEAIAVGMVLAFDYSVRINMCRQEDADRLRAHLREIGLPASISDLPDGPRFTAKDLAKHMMQDKKVESGALTLILAHAIGRSDIVKNADSNDIENFLKEKIAE